MHRKNVAILAQEREQASILAGLHIYGLKARDDQSRRQFCTRCAMQTDRNSYDDPTKMNITKKENGT